MSHFGSTVILAHWSIIVKKTIDMNYKNCNDLHEETRSDNLYRIFLRSFAVLLWKIVYGSVAESKALFKYEKCFAPRVPVRLVSSRRLAISQARVPAYSVLAPWPHSAIKAQHVMGSRCSVKEMCLKKSRVEMYTWLTNERLESSPQ